jgi:DNA-binding NarL/FixJ family response regulator
MERTRILLADDHAVVRAGIRNALEELPEIEVVGEVGDGPQLEAALRELRPGCVLIDVTMPDFEPISAISRIHDTYPDMKILVVSAYDDDVYVQGLLGVGVNGYHLKDQSLRDLQLAVQRVLAGDRWLSSRILDKLLAPSVAPPRLPHLTPRQKEILRLLRHGYDNQNIALEIGISVKTVENHLTRLYRQLKVQSRLEAVNYVREHPTILDEAPRAAAPIGPFPVTTARDYLSILVVDDNERFRSQLRRTIQRIRPNATIHEADNTASAVQLVKQASPQLAFVDVVLSSEDGIRCTHRIKQQSPNTRVILISAYPDREFRRRGMTAGATAFVDKKDLDSATLQQIIADMTG